MRLGKGKAVAASAKKQRPSKPKAAAVKKQKSTLIEIPLQDAGLADAAHELFQDPSAAAFLSQLDVKQIAKSRKAVKEEWKQNKKQFNADKPRQPITREDVSEEEEAEEEARPIVNKKSKGKKEKEGILIKDMVEDDLAFGSGDSDDSLSVMSDLGSDDDLTLTDSELDSLGESDLSGQTSDEEDSKSSETFTKRQRKRAQSDDEENVEEEYANKKRRKEPSGKKANAPLPVILADGTVKSTETNVKPTPRNVIRQDSPEEEDADDGEFSSESSSDGETETRRKSSQVKSDPLGPRFGRPGIRSILEMEHASDRLAAARNELAVLSGDIMADPENSLNLLKRLLSFCQSTFSNGKYDALPSVKVDAPIRALAFLSVLAVLMDIVPQYRIRDVTDKEQDNKVSQAVARQREWENGLVAVYKRYLEQCEREVKAASPLQPVALKCLCDLLLEKSQFNFAVNIMEVITHHVGRITWDESSEYCAQCIAKVFEQDQLGTDSLHLVRLLSKAVKTASYRSNPAVFETFLHLQLSNESGIRASGDQATREDGRPNQKWIKKGNRKGPHLSKKSRKAMKARKEVEKEYAEAEMFVSTEDRQKERTETLKMLFALYFRILKLEQNSPLLAPTLEGLAKFAHLINVDFFRDILSVLRVHIRRQPGDGAIKDLDLRQRLLCIVTAFDVLSGQGEALNIDLSDFVQDLYSILLAFSLSTVFEDAPGDQQQQSEQNVKPKRKQAHLLSESDLLFHVLSKVFIHSRTSHPPSRIAAFTKRLLVCSLNWPERSALRALEIVRHLINKYPQLDSLLTTDDLRQDGQYRADAQDIATSNAEMAVAHELAALANSHFSKAVRTAAKSVAQYTRN